MFKFLAKWKNIAICLNIILLAFLAFVFLFPIFRDKYASVADTSSIEYLFFHTIKPIAEATANTTNTKCIVVDTYNPIFLVEGSYTLEEIRPYAFEMVQRFRTMMANNEKVKTYFKLNRPDYNLDEKSFPVDLTKLELVFEKNKQPLDSPYIYKIVFENSSFNFYTRNPNTKQLELILQESYEEAQKTYGSTIKS